LFFKKSKTLNPSSNYTPLSLMLSFLKVWHLNV
jgi:hypothetical protein